MTAAPIRIRLAAGRCSGRRAINNGHRTNRNKNASTSGDPGREARRNHGWIGNDVADGWLVSCGVIRHSTCDHLHPSDPSAKPWKCASQHASRAGYAANRVTEAESLRAVLDRSRFVLGPGLALQGRERHREVGWEMSSGWGEYGQGLCC